MLRTQTLACNLFQLELEKNEIFTLSKNMENLLPRKVASICWVERVWRVFLSFMVSGCGQVAIGPCDLSIALTGFIILACCSMADTKLHAKN
jgi:hypothetical protein